MPSFVLSEASGRLAELYGEFQAPIASMVMDRFEAFEQQSIAKLLFARRESTGSVESYGGLTAVDAFQPVGENGAYPSGGFETGYMKMVRNMTWKGEMKLSRELVMDGNIADLRKKPQNFAKDYDRKFERFFAALLGAALSNKAEHVQNGQVFETKTSDGQNLFSKTHKPKVSGPDICNMFSDDFSVTVLDDMIGEMQDCRDDNGNILGLVPDTIIIPNRPSLKRKVLEVIGSEKDPNTPNNAWNAQYGNWRLVIWPYLNDFIGKTANPFILMDSEYNETADCAIWQDRFDVEIRDSIGANDEYIWSGFARFNGAFGDFRALYAGGMAGGKALA